MFADLDLQTRYHTTGSPDRQVHVAEAALLDRSAP